MTKAPARAVLGRRLRDQVYDLIKDDLKSGALSDAERFYEVDLAQKYGVSRTPVREALFQLVRDGLLVREERGYTLPVDTPKMISDRIEVHLLIDPRVAHYAASNADPASVKALRKAYERCQRAHATGKHPAYVDAIHQFRVVVRQLCGNEPLRRCAMLIEDQFLSARNELFKVGTHREMDLEFNARILAAIEDGDPEAAESATRDYMLAVRGLRFEEMLPGTSTAASKVPLGEPAPENDD